MSINTFKLEEYLGAHEFSAKHLLCCSDAETFTMSEILKLASPEDRQRWDDLHLGYTEVYGFPALREAVSSAFYKNLDANNILMFTGAEEGIFCTLHTLVKPEDHVIVLVPCYQSLFEIPKLKGAEISEIQLKEENNWRIDLNAIKHAIRSNTTCIIINFPHNPTGQVIEEDELKALVDICLSKNIWLFSDEVYRGLGTPNKPWAQPATLELPPKTDPPLKKLLKQYTVLVTSFASLYEVHFGCNPQTKLVTVS